MIATAKSIAPQQQAMAKEMQGSSIEMEAPNNEELDALETELQELKAKL